MNRLAALAAGVALVFSTGCTQDGSWSVRKTLGWDDPPPARVIKPTDKEIKNLPSVPLPIQERVERVGRDILTKNTFTGIEPLFMTIGMTESVLFHRGSEQLVISQGLVGRCASDGQLAAVLCSELGQMVAEKRSAKALGRDLPPIPAPIDTGGGMFPGGGAYDTGRQLELAINDQKYPKDGKRLVAADGTATARDLLKNAGYNPLELDNAGELLKLSPRSDQLRKQMGGAAPTPEWQQ
jgi:hypothetical protein